MNIDELCGTAFTIDTREKRELLRVDVASLLNGSSI